MVLAGIVVLIASILSFTNAVPGNLDDAFITLVYARHLLEDQSLYWNLQDGSIDGFTSLLDVWVKAAALAVSDDPLAMARDVSLTAHIVVGGSCVAFVAAAGFALGPVRAIAAGVVTGAAVSLHPAPAHAASFLLESPMYAALAIGCAALPLCVDLSTQTRGRRAWVAVLMLACLVRPEAQALAVGLAGLYAWLGAQGSPSRVRFVPLASVAAALAVYYVWHLLYFGALFPNTFYAKSSASRGQEVADGLAYLRDFAGVHGILGWLTLALPLLVALPLAMADWAHESARRRHTFVASAAVVTLLMVVWEGGDSYTGGRFLAVPIALSLVACGHVATCGPRIPKQIAWVTLVSAAVLGALFQLRAFAKGNQNSPIAASVEDYGCEKQAARALAQVLPSGEVMQTDWQRLKFFEDDLRVIDLHGLNDRNIARQTIDGPVRYGKFTHANALEVGADVWVYGHRLATEIPMAAVPIDLLLRHPPTYERFVGYEAPQEVVEPLRAAYLPASFPVCKRFFNVLVRREHAATLARSGVLVGDGKGGPFADSAE